MSLKASIDSECKKCSYAPEAEGTWRQQVRDCCGSACNLYPVRPLPSDESHGARGSRRAAIDAHCKACIYDASDTKATGTWRAQVAACKTESCGIYKDRPMPTNTIAIKEVE